MATFSGYQWHVLPGERDGLTSAEAKKRMEEYGPNEIPATWQLNWKSSQLVALEAA